MIIGTVAPEQVQKVAEEAAAVVEGQPLPDLVTIMTLGAVAAVVAWGLVEVVKLGTRSWLKAKMKKSPWWWPSSLRLLAMVFGTCAGLSLYGSLGGTGGGWPWGAAIGAGAGTLCTIIVAAIKRKVKEK